MKKITEETLNAIQENVRTRETQELDYRRENLFKGSWKDFKIKDLKPNLIPNGWDSFEPYGSGKNYVENWNFESDDLSGWNSYYTNNSVVNNTLVAKFKREEAMGIKMLELTLDDEALKNQEVIIRIKFKATLVTTLFNWENVSPNINYVYRDIGKWVVVEHRTKPTNNKIKIRLYGDRNTLYEGQSIEVDWVQVTAGEDQHLVVEKTPVGNGFTRIQTWGGNSPFKLQSYGVGYWESGKTYTFSLYLLSEQNIGIRLFNSGSHLIWSNDFPDYINHTVEHNRKVADITHISAKNVGDNLDFIASDPIINEGDKPNPTLLIEELDDGREHVKVYGATKGTKLVYSGNEGFIGEDYGLKTTIENNGIDLDFSTSLTEEKKRIEKGENKVNLQGELSTKLSIEIGVPSE